MNGSDIMLNLPDWLSWTSAALYAAYFILGAAIVVTVSGMAAEILTDEGRFPARTDRAH